MQAIQWIGRVAIAIGIATVAGCGGGGGGTGGGDSSLDFSPLSRDEVPSGTPVPTGMSDPYPLGSEVFWTYDWLQGGSAQSTAVVRFTTTTAFGERAVQETGLELSSIEPLSWTPQGLVQADPMGAKVQLPGLYEALPTWLYVPTPLPPQGAILRKTRQGSLKADIDGDGKADDFRLLIEQEFVGFESMQVLDRVRQTLHLRARVTLTLRQSQSGNITTTAGEEHLYLADGIGPVRIVHSGQAAEGSGLRGDTRLDLREFRNHDQLLTAAGRSFAVALNHNDLVYDDLHQLFLATSRPGPAYNQTQVTAIHALDGTVTQSPVFDGGLGQMALAADRHSLYVNFYPTGAIGPSIVRLALPGFQELGRLALPVGANAYSLGIFHLAASSVDPDEFAVLSGSTSYFDPSLIQRARSMQWLGEPLAIHAPYKKLAYTGNGQSIVALASTGLYRLRLQGPDLLEGLTPLTNSLAANWLEISDGLVLAGPTVFQDDDALTALGEIAGADTYGSCTVQRGSPRIICQGAAGQNQTMLVVSSLPPSFAKLGTEAYNPYYTTTNARPVAGPQGVLAFSEGDRIAVHASGLLK